MIYICETENIPSYVLVLTCVFLFIISCRGSWNGKNAGLYLGAMRQIGSGNMTMGNKIRTAA